MGGPSSGWAMGKERSHCAQCGRAVGPVSSALGLCGPCLRNVSPAHEQRVALAHARTREPYGLPQAVPRNQEGVRCPLCGNACVVGKGERGFCGLRENRGGRLRHVAGGRRSGRVSWYLDPLPTNCVAGWVCPAGDMEGKKGPEWRRFSVSPGPEYGYTNLAVFYESCTFNCLYCQNWHFRASSQDGPLSTAEQLAAAVRDNTSCICYFGGDPASQPGHAISASRLALRQARQRGRTLRICWETNGSMAPGILRCAARLSMDSFGCVKFDLKAMDEGLHRALTGVSNRRTLENFRRLASMGRKRPAPPFLVASTTLVPGYIDAEEVARIARFIAECDPGIPYSLLAFQPQFSMSDLPVTSRKLAQECLEAARGAGLWRVHAGNIHLLT